MKAYLEMDGIEQLENAATCMGGKLLIRLLAGLGCRVSEALGLTVEDIDFLGGTVTIQHLKPRVRLGCPKCGARLTRDTFCPKCGLKVEEAIVKEEVHRRMRTLPIDGETLRLLKISRHRACQIVKECAERANWPKLVSPETGRIHSVSPHRLRDAFAIHAMRVDDSGDGLRLLQEHLGHVSFNTTARYRKAAGEELKNMKGFGVRGW